MKFKIIADSSCDLDKNYLEGKGIGFSVAPLSINLDGEEYIDNEELNIENFMNKVNTYTRKGTTSCPSCGNYLKEMEGADYYFVVTLSSKLSGSYNSALAAKNMHKNPDNICVIDSKSTTGAMIIIIDKLVELINEGKSYEEISKFITKYVEENVGLHFILNKFDNLIKNGRMSPTKAKFASALAIKPICEAREGVIELSKKTIGFSSAIKTLVEEVVKKVKNSLGRQCVISHCLNSKAALRIKSLISEKLPSIKVRIIPMKGLCSYYALEKGVIVCYEH